MTRTLPTHLVCPSCKRPVTASNDTIRAECIEHGSVVPMRSVIVNLPLPSDALSSKSKTAALSMLHYQTA